jgi:hypothetical protein
MMFPRIDAGCFAPCCLVLAGRDPTVQAANGYTQFDIFYPFPEKPSGQVFRIKATLTWDGGQVETSREVEWRQ